MSLVATKRHPVLHQTLAATDETRVAAWLGSPYTAPEWTLFDSHNAGKSISLSFRMRMPDGTCFTEWPQFYAAVKEVAFFMRDRRFTRLRGAKEQAAYVRGLMQVCFALALEGFSSFEHVNSKVVRSLLPRIAKGTDAVLRASERLEQWLKCRERADSRGLVAGLPIDGDREVNSTRLMAMVGLPDSAARLPSVARLVAMASLECGLPLRAHTAPAPSPNATLTATSIVRFIWPLELLFVMRQTIAATSLPERPFTQSAESIAKKLGVDTAPTPIPPIAPALHLLAQAMLWVSNYSVPLIALWRSARAIDDDVRSSRARREATFSDLLAAAPPEGPPGCPWPLADSPSLGTAGRLSCLEAVRHLFNACFILIATFTARRREEILDLKASDLEGSDEAGWKLRTYIEKTLQRHDWIPVPRIVARAVQVLKALSEMAGKGDGAHVFRWMNPFGEEQSETRGTSGRSRWLNEFARWVGTPKWTPDGTDAEPVDWHWTPHQFRKFFAVVYFYRYRGATIEVLAQFLRHFSLDMTRRYLLLSRDNKRIFDEVEWGFKQQVARTIAVQGTSAKGGAAKRLAKLLIDQLRAKVRVTSTSLEDATSIVLRQMKRERMVITPRPWVDCSCPSTTEGAASAACRLGTVRTSETVGPDTSRDGPVVCCLCPHGIDNGRMSAELEREGLNAELIAVSDLEKGTMLAELQATRVISVARYRQVEAASAATSA